jgi:hypothetical protein
MHPKKARASAGSEWSARPSIGCAGVVAGQGGGGEQGGHEGAAQYLVVEGAPQGRVGVEHRGTPPTAGEGDRGRVDRLQQPEHGDPHLVGQV